MVKALESQLLSKQVQLQFENIKTQFQQIGKAEHFERLNSSDSSMLAMSEDLIQGPFSGMVLLLKQSNWKPRWISLKPDLAQQWSQLLSISLGKIYPRLELVKTISRGKFWLINKIGNIGCCFKA